MQVLRIAGCLALLLWLGNLGYQAWLQTLKPGGFAGVAYPVWVATAGFVLLGMHFVLNVVRNPVGPGALMAVLPTGGPALIRFSIFVGTWVLYVVALPHAGFIAATLTAMTVSILALGRFHPVAVVLAAATFVLTLKVLFITVFYISLPEGYLDGLVVELVFRLTS